MPKRLNDSQDELIARALAAQRLAIGSLTLFAKLADHFQIKYDFDQMADAEIDQFDEEIVNSKARLIERRAAEIAANVYRHLAAERREGENSLN